MPNGVFLTIHFVTTNIDYAELKSKQELQTCENFGMIWESFHIHSIVWTTKEQELSP